MNQILLSSLKFAVLFVGIVPCSAIIGGASQPGRFPYFVSLIDGNGIHQCGGSLIAPDMVLSAASCSTTGLAAARVGYQSSLPGSVFEEIPIINEYMHPSWNSVTAEYDIMVVKLAESASATPVNVNSDLSFPSTTASATEIEALGIGHTTLSVGSDLATTLQFKPMLAIVPMACLALLKTGNSTGTYRTQASDHQCFSDYRNYGGQCLFDEGGPMIEMGTFPTNDVVVAVMSSLSGACAAQSPTYPTRGTKTSLAFDFINATLCENSVEPPLFTGCPPPIQGASTPAPVVTPAPQVSQTPAPVPQTPAPVPQTPAPVPQTPAPVPQTPAPMMSPTLAPVEPPTLAPVVPATPAPIDPVTPAPVAPPPTPAPLASTPAPQTVVVGQCLARGQPCSDHLGCCSGRCMLNTCQSNPSNRFSSRTSLRAGTNRGGAANNEGISIGNNGGLFGFGFFGGRL